MKHVGILAVMCGFALCAAIMAVPLSAEARLTVSAVVGSHDPPIPSIHSAKADFGFYHDSGSAIITKSAGADAVLRSQSGFAQTLNIYVAEYVVAPRHHMLC